MKRSHGKPDHPGSYVRQEIIPSGMSVKEAAKRLGIGRPALSNFLNGNASLSPEMAVRLEKAFGTDRQELLDMQAAYDRQGLSSRGGEVAVRAFVPNFLTIKARQIEDWADSQIEARTNLAVLLRKLVHSTGSDLSRVDFPGFDNAQRKGPDGFVESGAATPWIPEGRSYWEFGTGTKPKTKAESDYAARLKTVQPAERPNSTFVFVTPRNWPDKLAWESGKNNARDWKAVRAFDASDIEQWLEQSVPGQIWLSELIGLPTSGFETLEQAWHRWADVCEPPLAPELFAPSIARHQARFKDWLNNESDKPFVIAADSRDEALAFLAHLFDDDELRQFKDRAAVFTEPTTLKRLLVSSVPFIPIVHSQEVERELGDAYRRLHCIAFRPRNAVDTEADLALDLLSYEDFEEALKAMGIEGGEIERLARESGRSPTILRRRLSKVPAIRTPAWTNNDEVTKTLVPMALIGAWHTASEADREIVSLVANQEYEEIEGDVVRLLRFDDSPVWSSGRYRGVSSKADAIFAAATMITELCLDRFLLAAEYVLSESDPALELPEEDRWAAALYDKTRDHSAALRTGICETLVILSVHGDNLFQSHLGIDVGGRVAGLIRRLLTPLTLEKLLSQDNDLPHYAEAAPDEFLKVIEEDLRGDKPVVLGLLKPVNRSSLFAWPSRTGLLWALECLAWNPQYLLRVSEILARLSRVKIDDNWENKPNASLQAIFRFWMPQTAASVERRVKALEVLSKRFPDVGWHLCLEQIKPGPRIGHATYRPRWRGDASGAGQVITSGEERYKILRKALDLLIARPFYDEKTLGDLVENLQGIPEEDRIRIWDLIDKWSQNSGEASKAVLRERIRRFAFTRRGRRRELGETIRNRAREAFENLQPRDPVIRHGWLFADHWVQESADELEEEEFDLQKRDSRVDKMRREAMTEIWNAHGVEGVTELLALGNADSTVGRYTALCLTSVERRLEFIRRCLSSDEELRSKSEGCLRGFLQELDVDSRTSAIRVVAGELSSERRVRLFTCAPFQESTWRLLDDYGEKLREQYWEDVIPFWVRHTPAELTELIDRLLEVNRPRAAFHAVRMDFDDVETSRLKRLLRDVATVDAEPADNFTLDRHDISEALDSLSGRPGVTEEQMAQLEFLYLNALDHSKHGIPNLEGQLARSPEAFAQAVVLAYKRSDGGQDPSEWTIENAEQREAAALAAHRLLGRMKTIPGTTNDGTIDREQLIAWLVEVRRLCREYGRADIGDYCLGELLANAPEGARGRWPCSAVCEAMEEIASSEVGEGFYIRIRNSRGAEWRGEGGDQERELATKYRTWAERLHFEYPFVGGVLEDIAKSYDREAAWHDADAETRRRLDA